MLKAVFSKGPRGVRETPKAAGQDEPFVVVSRGGLAGAVAMAFSVRVTRAKLAPSNLL